MGDLISKQGAINKINERQRKLIYCFGSENDMVKIMDIARSIIIAMPSVQPEENCDTCKHGYFGDSQCDNCRVGYPSNYERRADE